MLPANKVENGYIRSGMVEGTFVPEMPYKSLYLQMVKLFNENQQEGDWIWLRNFITKENYMASDFQKNAQKFAKIFKDLGLREGNTIHACVGNHNYTYSLFGGAWILGAVVSCGDVALDSSAITCQLLDLQAKVVVCTSETCEKVINAAKVASSKLAHDIKVISFGAVQGALDVIEMLDTTDGSQSPEPVQYSDDDLKNKEAVIFWTSGTTGAPKGICHTHFSAWNFGGWTTQTVKKNVNIVSSTCFFHAGGFFIATLACMKRQTYFHMFGKGMTLNHILDAIRESKCGRISIGTHHYVRLSEAEELKNADPDDFDNVEVVSPVGAAVPSQCEIPFKAKFRNLKYLLNVYGMTEVGYVIASGTSSKLGYVLPGHTVKVRDPNTGKTLGPNQTGEICVKNEITMKQYWNRKQVTNEFFDHEGFACTGDLGYYDDAGDMHYVDRMKELIKYKNNHVGPTEIEDILQEIPSVRESLVFGFEDPNVQELISAVIVVNPGQTLTKQEVLDHVNNKVVDFKKIRGPILFRETIPRNSIGKLVRKEMRTWAQNQARKGTY